MDWKAGLLQFEWAVLLMGSLLFNLREIAEVDSLRNK